MHSLSAISTGFIEMIRAKGIWLLLYLALLFFALLFAMPISNLIEMHLGNTLTMDGRPGTFDYTLLADILNNDKTSIGLIIYQGKWIILLFLVASILLTAGTVAHFFFQKERFILSGFIQDASKYFWRLLRANIYFLAFHGILLALTFMAFQAITGGLSPFEIENDGNITTAFYVVMPFYLIGALLIIMISDICKYEIIRQDDIFIHTAIGSAAKLVFRNLISLLLFYFLLGLFFMASYFLWQFLQSIVSPQTGFGIWFLLIAGQFFVLARVGIRVLKYAGLDQLRRNFDY